MNEPAEATRQAASRAAAWLADHADTRRCRCTAVLVGAAPLESVLGDADPAGVGEALNRLRTLDDLRALASRAAESACALLLSAQADDGAWSTEDDAGEEDRILTSARAAGWLGKTVFVRPSALDAAGAFLARHWSPDRVQGFVLPAVAAWSAFFANVPHELSDEGLQWCGRELERGYRAGRFDPVRTARVLVACDAKSLPGGRVDAAELVEAICVAQAEDGSLGDAGATYDALVALVRLA